jgi:hypothetical protein
VTEHTVGPNERRLAFAVSEGIVDAMAREADEGGCEILVDRHEWAVGFRFRGATVEEASAKVIEHVEAFPTIDLDAPTMTGPPLVLPYPPKDFETQGLERRT